MNGKGSKTRPLSVPREEFCRRWDETFSAVRVFGSTCGGGKTDAQQRYLAYCRIVLVPREEVKIIDSMTGMCIRETNP